MPGFVCMGGRVAAGIADGTDIGGIEIGAYSAGGNT
jgi:hypothetical protein